MILSLHGSLVEAVGIGRQPYVLSSRVLTRHLSQMPRAWLKDPAVPILPAV